MGRRAPRLPFFAIGIVELIVAVLKYLMSVFWFKVHRPHAYSIWNSSDLKFLKFGSFPC